MSCRLETSLPALEAQDARCGCTAVSDLCYTAQMTLDSPCSAHDRIASIPGVYSSWKGLSVYAQRMFDCASSAEACFRCLSPRHDARPPAGTALGSALSGRGSCRTGGCRQTPFHLPCSLSGSPIWCTSPAMCTSSVSITCGAVHGRMIAGTSGHPFLCIPCFMKLMLDSLRVPGQGLISY